jgi:hypothetical protein
MNELLPEVKFIAEKGSRPYEFARVAFDLGGVGEEKARARLEKVIRCKLRDFRADEIFFHGAGSDGGMLTIEVKAGFVGVSLPTGVDEERLRTRGYSLESSRGRCMIRYSSEESLCNAISTLKQLFLPKGTGRAIGDATIHDYPGVDVRSMSTTFAWYAGYGRIGFDSQLWGFEEWKDFLDVCSDYKINQLNMCMYGYWPFDFPEYPETCLKNIPMKVWNPESGNYVDIHYTHPNLVHEFLPGLIEYAHLLSIRIFTYVGLNSYNGGFSNIHREKRMKLPPGSRYVNDFDSLCLSDAENIEYLKKAVRRIVRLGLDGIVFEESEEAYWFCTCDACRAAYGQKTSSPAEAKHDANYVLLKTLHGVIKEENPACEVGLRAWREPPLEKSVEYLQHCCASIPSDVCLYWAPGLYVPPSEFSKWVKAFGKERICGRDTESNAWSSTQGRLLRIFKSNVLRGGEETNDQFIEKDIEQHRGSVANGVRGINGYLFEYYGYFLHLLAHANFGWGSQLDDKGFYEKAVRMTAGKELAEDVLFVLSTIFTIHESQIKLFPAEFPFLRNNVSEKDVAAIREAQKQWPLIDEKISRIIASCESRDGGGPLARHFRKIRNAHLRNRHIYDLCLAAIRYDAEKSEEKKAAILREIERHNEKDFDLVRSMFFDVLPVEMTGIRSCMYPYHELKRVIDNALGRNSPPDERMIYLGVEALGWLWI